MRQRRSIWILLCLLCLAGAWFFWQHEHGRKGSPSRPRAAAAPAAQPRLASSVAASHSISTNALQISMAEWNTNKFAGRLSNTAKTIGQLVGDSHAILLENALIDTRLPLNFVFPKNLQSQGDPGAYIVQAKGPINQPFRAMLTDLGAKIVAYIPNDAYLVRASASVATALAPEPSVQAVIPYEPYYKIQSSLLFPAVSQLQLPDGAALNLALFGNDAKTTISEIEKLGGQVEAQTQSPFGPVVRVIPPKNWTALATLPGVQIVEPVYQRATANDLARATLGVAADSLTATNYLGLTGSNILVAVDDTGIDARHPDLTANTEYGRTIGVIGAPSELVDTNGHGTHVAGIIAGDGAKSTTVTNAPGSTLPGGTGTNYQFRGMAPGATLYSLSLSNSDQQLQEAAAQTNALISNNSWNYVGASSYDLAAASYDAATRDALPTVTGSQPVLFVFSAGNEGNGDDSSDFGGGIADSIESPATAKDVITVGAIQENRNITATVTNADGSSGQPWQAETSTGYRVAGFSSRGNVGIGIEGTYGRYKPDVCAPGTFIISTRSEQWDIGTYFYQDPTNNQIQTYTGILVQPDSLWKNTFPSVPTNAVQATINISQPIGSPFLFTYLPIYVGLFSSAGYDFFTTNDAVSIPPDGRAGYLQSIFTSQGFLGGFQYAVSNNTSGALSFDLQTDVITTNGSGTYFLVLSNLDQYIGTPNGGSTGPGPYYRYETGTSMAAADVSGVLALMQEFYANAYGVMPSPAMLKAMLINGAQATGFYNYQVQNSLNYEGWGLVNLPDSLPPGITNQLGVPCSAYVQDQNPTNALATGDSQTFYVTTTNALPLRVTLAWTDPPGDPAAAIKLVNNLTLVVTNLANPTNPIVYYGNDIGASSTVNNPHGTNTPPVFDSINNVQNVYLPPGAGTNFSVTVAGYRVNVNAVTAQTNNVVQDYALVISCGNGQLTNVMTVSGTPSPGPAPPPVVSNPTGDQQVTYMTPATMGSGGNETSYQLLLNQFVGASSPLLGTNTIPFSSATATNQGFSGTWQVTVGQTNQWHFYVVTNTASLSNAAFITFDPNAPDPDTLSVPREGVFGGTVGNATREADIDLYVSTDSSLTNLNPVAISNAVVLGQIGGPPGTVLPGLAFAGASLGRGTTEFVADTNAWSRTPQPMVYYVGVKSEDQMAAEYGFIAVFTQTPFSQMNNGVQTVNGVPVPMNIPDGSPTIPGRGYIFGLALYPMTVGTVTVSNVITHQNFGDLIGTLTFNGGHPDVLNNHDSFGNPPGPYYLSYDDSAGGGVPGSRPSDGPGSLVGYMGQQAIGVWQLTEVDDSLTQTGAVSGYTVTIQPNFNVGLGNDFSIPPKSWFYGFIDVPPGATNLAVYVTNATAVIPPLELFAKFGSEPTTNDFDKMTLITNSLPGPGVWGGFTIGPPIESGRYFIGVYNPSTTAASGILFAIPGLGAAPVAIFNSTDTPKPILDDAVTDDSIYVPANQTIASLDVALAVQHPRISDLVFHLISPDGTRLLLMENRGGTSTNGAGGVTVSSTNNIALTNGFEGTAAAIYPANSYMSGWLVDNPPNGSVQVLQSGYLGSRAYEGTNFLWMNGQASEVSTNVATAPGQLYTLTFAYAADPNQQSVGAITHAFVNAGSASYTVAANYNNTWANLDWHVASFQFTATSASTLVQLGGYNDFGTNTPVNGVGILLDDVVVAAVPTTNYSYLVFTENTNLTTTPIKFAVPPFEPGVSSTAIVPGTANPWLAGMPNGSTASTCFSPPYDYAPTNSPTQVAGLPLIAGDLLTFSATGLASIDPVPSDGAGPNGSPQAIGNPTPDCAPENGLPECRAPYESLVGVFLDDNAPNSSPVPNALDFSTQTNRDYTLLAPGLKQVFFIGTGLTSFGASHHVMVPQGATRLFLGIIDGAGWYNNSGAFTANINENAGSYYLPEQPLDAYDGMNAQGPWTLEIQDDRVGATNPPPSLLSWQLRFTFVTEGTNGIGIPPGTTQTNVIPANSWAYYQINVPTNADMATNTLVFATGPLYVWFNPANNPIGSTPPDSLLLGNSTGGSSTLSTFSVPTNIVPGGVYYIGLQNTNNYQVTNGFEVNFHYFQTTPLTPGVPVTNTVAGAISGDGVDYYSIVVPTNADYATNLLLSSTQPVNVWFNQSKDPVCLTPPDYLLIANATSGVAILSSNSVPPLQPGLTYYLAVQNTNAGNATYALAVNFHTISILTNGVPTTNSVPSNSFAFYEVQVPTNADYATNLLLFADLPVNVWFNQNGPPTGTNPPDYLLIGNATSGTSILNAGSAPPLVPGSTYYLGVQNTNAVTVNFGLQVNFHLVVPNIITGPTITATNINGTNGFLLAWSGPTNYQYIIQWTTNLAPPIPWNTVSNPVINVTYTGGNGDYSWFDDGSQTGGWPPQKFYRVLANLLSAPITNSAPVTNVIVPGAITPLTVTVPASAASATNVLISATGPVNVWFNQNVQPTGNTGAGDVLILSNVTSGSFLLTGGSVPPLVPSANYYLGLQNTGTTNVSFVFQVNFAYAAPSSNAPAISTITFTNIGGTKGVLLTWYAPTNYQFQVQWTTTLIPGSWTTIPGVVLTNLPSPPPVNGIGEFQYFDNGSLTGGFGLVKFYRLVAYPPGTTIPPSLVISSVTASPGGLQIQWSGSTNYIYDVAWTTNLALPTASWIIISNLTIPVPLAYTNGVFTYTATNALTAGSASAEFFRVLLLP